MRVGAGMVGGKVLGGRKRKRWGGIADGGEGGSGGCGIGGDILKHYIQWNMKHIFLSKVVEPLIMWNGIHPLIHLLYIHTYM